MFARVIGPFYVITPVIALVRDVVPARDVRSLPGLSHFGVYLPGFSDFGVWPWATGAFILLSGLIIIAFHQYWRSVAAVIVSLLGWLMVVRGLLILAFPATFMSMTNSVTAAGALWRTVYICVALIGLYLTYVGWKPAPSRPASQAASPTRDHPHAA